VARFAHRPISAASRERAEAAHVAPVAEEGIELVGRAKYMQVLESHLPGRLPTGIIIPHLSFPAGLQRGPSPTNGLFQRGVKLIGATAHYVTEELDIAGRFIEQATVAVESRDEVEDSDPQGPRTANGLALGPRPSGSPARQVMVYGGRTAVFLLNPMAGPDPGAASASSSTAPGPRRPRHSVEVLSSFGCSCLPAAACSVVRWGC